MCVFADFACFVVSICWRWKCRSRLWIFSAARASGAGGVITTEKDLVRLLPFRPFPLPVAFAPLIVEMESPAEFDAWLRARISVPTPPVVSAFRRKTDTE